MLQLLQGMGKSESINAENSRRSFLKKIRPGYRYIGSGRLWLTRCHTLGRKNKNERYEPER
jgi:hypothetical protein